MTPHSARLRAIDPLLPTAQPLPESPDRFTVDGATALCTRQQPDLESLDAAWYAANEFRLSVRVDADDPPAAMDRALSIWRERVAAQAKPDDPDSAAVLTWPSRDTAMVKVFVRHGLVPRAIVAARLSGRPTGALTEGATVRLAGPSDVDAATALQLAVVAWDAQFNTVFVRPSTEDGLRQDLAKALHDGQRWIWIAEHAGTPVGLLRIEPPETAGWIAPIVDRSPAAYISCLVVSPELRGGGVGTALVDAGHAALDRAGIAVTLLHYAAMNPLSVPFWSRVGYRPLWTTWQAMPASHLR